MGLLVVREPDRLGFGLQAQFQRERWQGAVEAAAARAAGTDLPWRAVLARAGWSAGRKGTLEAACAAANGGAASLAPRAGGGCVATLALPGEGA